MVKVALYLSGFLRTFNEEIKNGIIKMMTGCDYDIYVSTYYTLDQLSYKKSGVMNEKGKIVKTRSEIQEMFEGLPVKSLIINDNTSSPKICIECHNNIAVYGPKSPLRYKNTPIWLIKTEPTHCSDCKLDNMVVITNGVSQWDQWVNINICHQEAIKSGINYDLFVRSRPDIFVTEYIDWSISIPDDCFIYGEGGGGNYKSPNCFDDMFSIGGRSYMDDFVSLDKILKYTMGGHNVMLYIIERYKVIRVVQVCHLVWTKFVYRDAPIKKDLGNGITKIMFPIFNTPEYINRFHCF